MLSSKEHSNEHASDLLICCVPAVVRYSVLAVNENLHEAELLLQQTFDQKCDPSVLSLTKLSSVTDSMQIPTNWNICWHDHEHVYGCLQSVSRHMAAAMAKDM